MKLRIILACALLVICLGLLACSPQEASLEVSCDDFYKQHHITEEIQVYAGDSFTVTLCSNPTTGFQWSETVQISDQTVLQQTEHSFLPPEAKGVEGAPGKEVWTFKALRKETATISMEYSRPWEGGEKGEWTFVLTVTVK